MLAQQVRVHLQVSKMYIYINETASMITKTLKLFMISISYFAVEGDIRLGDILCMYSDFFFQVISWRLAFIDENV